MNPCASSKPHVRLDHDWLNEYGSKLGAALNLYVRLLQHFGSNETCWPSHQLLAEETGTSVSTVKRHLAIISDLQLIRIEELKTVAGGQKTNRYHRLNPKNPVAQNEPPTPKPVVQNDLTGSSKCADRQFKMNYRSNNREITTEKNGDNDPLYQILIRDFDGIKTGPALQMAMSYLSAEKASAEDLSLFVEWFLTLGFKSPRPYLAQVKTHWLDFKKYQAEKVAADAEEARRQAKRAEWKRQQAEENARLEAEAARDCERAEVARKAEEERLEKERAEKERESNLWQLRTLQVPENDPLWNQALTTPKPDFQRLLIPYFRNPAWLETASRGAS